MLSRIHCFQVAKRCHEPDYKWLATSVGEIFWMQTQCLASWFSCQEISWIFDISCQDLGHYSWQSSQDFARFFKIVERNPGNFLDLLPREPKITKILAREPSQIFDFLSREPWIFEIYLPRSWQLILERFVKFARYFKIVERNPRKSLGVLGNKTCNNQDLSKRNKNVLHQSNTRSIDILWAVILENLKNGLLLYVLLSKHQLGLTNKEWSKNKLK